MNDKKNVIRMLALCYLFLIKTALQIEENVLHKVFFIFNLKNSTSLKIKSISKSFPDYLLDRRNRIDFKDKEVQPTSKSVLDEFNGRSNSHSSKEEQTKTLKSHTVKI